MQHKRNGTKGKQARQARAKASKDEIRFPFQKWDATRREWVRYGITKRSES